MIVRIQRNRDVLTNEKLMFLWFATENYLAQVTPRPIVASLLQTTLDSISLPNSIVRIDE